MKKGAYVAAGGGVAVLCAGVLALFARHARLGVLAPAGLIASSERALMVHALLLMLIVIVPVFCLAMFFAWHYRAGNTKAKYLPNWEHSKMDELVWWAIPFEIVLVLAALTWTSTHELDPHVAIAGHGTPLVVEVVALDWKWLFIYPEQGIATTNFVEFPAGRTVEFQITADAPMNALWIPKLGGMIMAMTGMVNPLYLETDTPGDYQGGSANYSGEGFASMQFTARAVPEADFDAWVAGVKRSPQSLTWDAYRALATPGATSTSAYWGSVAPDLYNEVLMQFMQPGDTSSMHMH